MERKSNIIVCLDQLNQIKNRYQGNIKEADFDSFVSQKVSFYSSLDYDKLCSYGFSGKEHYDWFDPIKDSILFINEDYEKVVSIKKDNIENVKKENTIKKIFSIKGQVESYYELNPFFYDASTIFWKWDIENMKYIKCDEVDLLIAIERELNVETIESKKKSELIESFKQVGRSHIPEKPDKHWIQFLDKVYDGRTGDFICYASPNYQFMNPICWKVGESEDIPNIDRLLTEWVGENNKIELYEFMAYLITRDRFLQRIFAFCGGGSNGKGTFMKLCTKLVGRDNCVASDLKQLSESQFEPAVLYGKLMCVMGEISYADLKNTNEIKKIAGEDLISFQFKGKTPFTDENTALAVCLTNSLPSTPDKSLGFYRKWHLIDFPNQFDLISDNPIEKIPEEEFENLILKLLGVLKGLYQKKCLTNEGSFEERIKKYEERSNPVMQFINQYCDEDNSFSIPLREFTNYCNEYLKSKHLRILTANQVGKILREEGFAVGNRRIEDISQVVILNIKFKPNISTILTIKTIKKLSQIPYRETTENFNSSASFNNKELINKFSNEEITQAGYTKEELERMLE